jgi:hypothetical protein
MAQEKENFLGRWSRRKAQERRSQADNAVPQKAAAQERAPELPPVDKLTPDSEFAGFMHPKVEDALRRVALKKLFADPHFNTPDPFEPFSGDWTVGETLTDEALAQLNQMRTLFPPKEKQEEQVQPAGQKTEFAEEQPKKDEPGRQDA